MELTTVLDGTTTVVRYSIATPSATDFWPTASVSLLTPSIRTSVSVRQPTLSTSARSSTSTSSSTSIALIIPTATLPLPPGGSGGTGSGGSGGSSGGGSGGGGGTDDGVNGRGGDIADQSVNSSMPSKSVVSGVSAGLIIAFVAGAALVYYRRVKKKEQERRISAGPVDPQGYDIDYDTIEAGKTER
ncbi:hypothetical protein BGX34_011901 [Mortierella sp. NVP85]|nr:hypothetical protein BGX34_011901 [Mortierella sp. NVP85]